MPYQDLLNKLGLSPNASKIYLALLGTPPQTVAAIAKKAGLYRPAVYHAIPELEHFGLLSQTTAGKRTAYVAQPPTLLNNLLNPLQEELQTALPRLEELADTRSPKPVIRYFDGPEGIRHAFEYLMENAKKNDIIYRYESPKDHRQNAKLYPEVYRKLATKNNLTGHSLLQKFDITNEATQARRSNYLERYGKAIPAKLDPFDYNITHLILNDKVAFIDYESKTASVIQSKRFADFQRQIFKILFNKLA